MLRLASLSCSGAEQQLRTAGRGSAAAEGWRSRCGVWVRDEGNRGDF